MAKTEDFSVVDPTRALEQKNNGGSVQQDYGIPPTGAMRVQTQYSTAVHVIKPRNLEEVQRRCLEEAAIAGDDFYYSWKQGGEDIEGLTVGAALAMVRNFGNCAVDCKVEDAREYYVFHGAFIDLETGFNLVRPFRQRKESPTKKDGSAVYKGERGVDIIFQIGASKSIRNVVLNAVPKWLSTKVMDRAKENIVGKIEKMGVAKAKEMVVKKAATLNIPVARIAMIYGKEEVWDVEAIVKISSALRAIDDGVESVDSLFPLTGAEKKSEPAPSANPVEEASAKKRDALLAEIKVAKTTESLKKLGAKLRGMVDGGEITGIDAEAVDSAIIEREEALKL